MICNPRKFYLKNGDKESISTLYCGTGSEYDLCRVGSIERDIQDVISTYIKPMYSPINYIIIGGITRYTADYYARNINYLNRCKINISYSKKINGSKMYIVRLGESSLIYFECVNNGKNISKKRLLEVAKTIIENLIVVIDNNSSLYKIYSKALEKLN